MFEKFIGKEVKIRHNDFEEIVFFEDMDELYIVVQSRQLGYRRLIPKDEIQWMKEER